MWTLPCLVALAYPLSIGPAVRLYDDGALPESAVVIYEPVTFVIDSMPLPIGESFEWYLDLWRE